MSDLFSPFKLGALELNNRILMAPLTRCRADADHVPTPIMADYYAQRASAGLIASKTGMRCLRRAADLHKTGWLLARSQNR